ncbi:hypothetical protein HELRODRAFT_185050 [Helobdella robusta]|uniref:DNA polymerase alpha subunit B n=1 Tax=Helobdella robusta TaxID=6412 RepID=T1FMB9_HELRO|nr:hypothetical protein HELRODRAFT_185050 [Helobdella robusta]ESN99074.1 hypothetical protein HELRODRAFT_185050 [Helobdella robusta]
MSLSLEDFKQEFAEWDLVFPVNLYDKIKEVCEKYDLSAEDFVSSWQAHKQNHKIKVNLNLEHLDFFAREEFEKKFVKKSSKVRSIPKTPIVNNHEANTPASSKKRPIDITPEMANKKIILSEEDQFVGTPSRAPSSLNGMTPSAKYSSRKNKGEVVASNCENSLNDRRLWRRQDVNRLVTVLDYEEAREMKPHCKYMFHRASEKYYTLNFMISDMQQRLLSTGVVEEFTSIGNVFQDPQIVIGRVNFDVMDKQLSLEEENTGLTVPLSLNSLADYFIFTGQVAAFECTNPTGKCLNALRFIEPVYPPQPPLKDFKDLSVLVACGPFSTQDSTMYEPLNDLITQIEQNTPDLCILLGPFIDTEFAELQINEDLGSLQQNCFNKLKEMAASLHCHVVIIPSQRDFLHEFVYPQPPFKLSSSSFVSYMSDPCTLDVDGLVIGVTSTDVLMHMSKDVISKSQKNVDRFTKLVQTFLGQHNFYPVNPPSNEVNVDLELFDVYAKLTVTPHLLILPSELKCFVKTVNCCTCVNPGKLSKKEAGGTYAHIKIRANAPAVNVGENSPGNIENNVTCEVKVVKI